MINQTQQKYLTPVLWVLFPCCIVMQHFSLLISLNSSFLNVVEHKCAWWFHSDSAWVLSPLLQILLLTLPSVWFFNFFFLIFELCHTSASETSNGWKIQTHLFFFIFLTHSQWIATVLVIPSLKNHLGFCSSLSNSTV